MTDSTKESAELAAFRRVEWEIRRKYPELRMESRERYEMVDAMLEFPAQDGLRFAVSINLQGDELHLNAGDFWCEWFPCTKASVAADFTETVLGLMCGNVRVVEKWRGPRGVAAYLERFEKGRWRRIATHLSMAGLIPWGISTKVLCNVASERTPV